MTPESKIRRSSRYLARLVRLLLTPTWKLRIENQMEHAQRQYDEAVAAYHEAEEKCLDSFYEHNQASYWKGRRDALRVFLPNMKHTAPETRENGYRILSENPER
jgi:hypothetical protein